MGLKHNSHTPRVLPESAKPFLKSLTPNFQADRLDKMDKLDKSGHVISDAGSRLFFLLHHFHMDFPGTCAWCTWSWWCTSLVQSIRKLSISPKIMYFVNHLKSFCILFLMICEPSSYSVHVANESHFSFPDLGPKLVSVSDRQ